MIFIDSWVWIEFFQEETSKPVKAVLQRAVTDSVVISTIVLMEVKYSILKKYGKEMADSVINTIEIFPNIKVLPVTSDVARTAADIRKKYYNKKRQLSYADAINIATAMLSGCNKLYSGDRDFEKIDELKTEIIM
ncbi:MAG: PIN domain-containing protein [Candidatus Aenigmarchaeota archaeon]|nr:PIN domain-containing protein [Candidatus Aenigmarchaeota archaeon]